MLISTSLWIADLMKMVSKNGKKKQKKLISKFNIYGNFSKDRGVTILAKKSIGVSISNVEKIDEKTQYFSAYNISKD